MSVVNIKPAIHETFYLWARDFVQDKAVLDVGCGSGEGTAILAQTARKVMGVDVDPSMIELARSDNSRGNVDFRVMDCAALDLPSASFDVVVCNALLEYLSDPEAFFREAGRVLCPHGRIICGTKNLERSLKSRSGKPLYRNHLQEFTAETLARSMAKYFGSIEIFGEKMRPRAEAQLMNPTARRIEQFLVRFDVKHLIPMGIRQAVRRRITGVDFADVDSSDFYVTDESVDDAIYVIGVGDVISNDQIDVLQTTE